MSDSVWLVAEGSRLPEVAISSLPIAAVRRPVGDPKADVRANDQERPFRVESGNSKKGFKAAFGVAAPGHKRPLSN